MPTKKPVENKDKELLLAWTAPERPFIKRSKEFYKTAGSVAFLVAVVLLFMQEWFLILTIAAFFFFVYVLSTVPPKQVEHKITERGLLIADQLYRWRDLAGFWFGKMQDEEIVSVGMPFKMPGRLIMLLGDEKEEKIREVLAQFLMEREVEPGFVDKASDWLKKKVPLEKK